jgi:hypothetical protein
MLGRSLAGLVFALVVGGLVFAEESRGVVTKVEDGSISIRSGFGKENTEEKTFKVGKGVKVSRVVGKDKEDVKLTLDELKTAVKVTTVFVTVTHDGDVGTEIKTGGFGGAGRGKGKGKRKDDK